MKLHNQYNKQELFQTIEKISIEKVENQVITKFDNRVINITNVSNRYEIFDIVKYLKEKINTIEKNFQINKYRLTITAGRQYLQLISDSIEINGIKFHKSFYIANSTDRSLRLSFNVGLDSDKFYMIGNNIGVTKKHLTGVTKFVNDASEGLNGETFNEQIESVKSLIGHRIKFSKIREVILGDKEDIPQINHRKFDAFKNVVRYYTSDAKIDLSKEQLNMLFTPSEKLTKIENDFYIDAFFTFAQYLKIFNNKDSHIIKNETERIMKITQWKVRNDVLEELGV